MQVTERLDEENDVGEERRKFGASFYALGCCAVVVRWAQGGMRVAPDTLARGHLLPCEGQQAGGHPAGRGGRAAKMNMQNARRRNTSGGGRFAFWPRQALGPRPRATISSRMPLDAQGR